MNKYFEPDLRWDIFGVKTLEEYLQRYLVKGAFHNHVSEDVKEAFISVEYLLAHAYYYYPLCDEAFNKALRIVEMAIKQKATTENIKLTDQNGKYISLDSIIKKLYGTNYFQPLNKDIKRFRKIRNTEMHPSRNTLIGQVSIKKNIQLFVNIINRIFHNNDWHNEMHTKTEEIAEQIKVIQSNLLVLDNGENKYLVDEILDFKVINNNLLVVCNPIITNVTYSLSNHSYSKPIAMCISNYEIRENEIKGLANKNRIHIYQTLKRENIDAYKKYKGEMALLMQEDIDLYKNNQNFDASWMITEIEYNLSCRPEN